PNQCTVTTPGRHSIPTRSSSELGATAARVYVTDATNAEQLLFSTTSGSQSLNWIQALPQQYTFRLWDYSSGSRGAQLASVNVAGPAEEAARGQMSARLDSRTVLT